MQAVNTYVHHEQTIRATFKRVVTNVVCDNTMAAGLAERGQQVKIKHSKHSKLRLNEARDALNIVYQVADDFVEQVKRLCETSVSDHQWAAFLDEFAPVPNERGRSRSLAENKRQALDRMWRYDDRVSPWAGSQNAPMVGVLSTRVR